LARELTLAPATDQAICKITCPSAEVADNLAQALIERQFAACVNIVPGITSVYRWQGEICRDSEVLLLVKTSLDVAKRLLKVVEEIHPYEVPEVLWTRVSQGSQSYLDWLTESVERD
jgi:periplasmic divalent cation tolerance protein